MADKTTALERSELEQGRLAVIGAITSGLGHDLRNAIMPALLRLDTLTASANLTNETRRQLLEVRSSLSLLQGLASGLHLLASDAEAPPVVTGHTELHRWWHDVEPLVHAATSAGTSVESDVPDTLPTVSAPPNLLAQIALALVLHARESMHASESPQLRISAAQTTLGASITLEFRARAQAGVEAVQSQFATSPTATSDSKAGLTLDNLQLLLTEHDGNLTRLECDASGAVFTIDLAAVASDSPTVSNPTPSARVELTDLRQRAVAQFVLAQKGYTEWTSAKNGSSPGSPGRPSVIVCDAASVQGIIDRLPPDAAANGSPSLIVVGTPPMIPLKAAHVTWIAPSQLGLLSSVLP